MKKTTLMLALVAIFYAANIHANIGISNQAKKLVHKAEATLQEDYNEAKILAAKAIAGDDEALERLRAHLRTLKIYFPEKLLNITAGALKNPSDLTSDLISEEVKAISAQ